MIALLAAGLSFTGGLLSNLIGRMFQFIIDQVNPKDSSEPESNTMHHCDDHGECVSRMGQSESHIIRLQERDDIMFKQLGEIGGKVDKVASDVQYIKGRLRGREDKKEVL